MDLSSSSVISVPWVSLTPSGTSGNGLREGAAWLFSALKAVFGAACSDGRKSDRPTLSKVFFVADGHSLITAAQIPTYFITSLLSQGVLVHQLSQKEKKALICSVCQFPWCKYSCRGYQVDVTEYGAGKT